MRTLGAEQKRTGVLGNSLISRPSNMKRLTCAQRTSNECITRAVRLPRSLALIWGGGGDGDGGGGEEVSDVTCLRGLGVADGDELLRDHREHLDVCTAQHRNEFKAYPRKTLGYPTAQTGPARS